ncbi:16577_t:CDS:1, partial [Gigaspora margarita]
SGQHPATRYIEDIQTTSLEDIQTSILESLELPKAMLPRKLKHNL